jgi:hypothetical protein
MSKELPNLRNNITTWAVPVNQVPAVTEAMLDTLPPEDYDPSFHGQELVTTYFDTQKLDLRKRRLSRDNYMTLRVRCYQGAGDDAYALSAKTEEEKFRVAINEATAELLVSGQNPMPALSQLLPSHLFARLLDLSQGQPIRPAVQIVCRRYAREDDQDRLTLDLCVRTDTGKCLPYAVCEFKSISRDQSPPAGLLAIPIRPSPGHSRRETKKPHQSRSAG